MIAAPLQDIVAEARRILDAAADVPLRTLGGAAIALSAEGELLLYEDSYRNVAIAVSRGSAAALLGLEEDGELVVRFGVL